MDSTISLRGGRVGEHDVDQRTAQHEPKEIPDSRTENMSSKENGSR